MNKTNWYKDAIVYQIYPRSFMDSNNDGLGDIRGIISKLDYLESLGINCVWLSPIYASPQVDNGYDISDYKSIYPPFGTIDDFKEMVNEMHKRGIKLLMDLVINHTSTEHFWFKEAIKSKDNPYHDYYIFKKGKKNKMPTNWVGFFGNKAWEYVKSLDEYYLHVFAKEQADLNFENPKVREEIKDIMKYWLDLGVDGFRCDVINLISKKQTFKNGHELFLHGYKNFVNGPRLHEFLQEFNKDVFSKYDSMIVGETMFTTIDDAKMLIAKDRCELDLLFNFDHTNVDSYFGVKWIMKKFKLKNLKKAFDKWQYKNIYGYNTLFIENHDQRRSVGRFGTNINKRDVGAKMLASMLYFQKGIPFIYQGQEIGMTNGNFNNLDDFKDTEIKTFYEKLSSLHIPKSYILKSFKLNSRDNSRTPMQWDKSINSGFSKASPWLKVNDNYLNINVANSINDNNSILNFYKKIIKIRKNEIELRDAEYIDLLPKSNKLYIYERISDNYIYLCVNNFKDKNVKFNLSKFKKITNLKYDLLLNNYENIDINYLKPYETRFYKFYKN